MALISRPMPTQKFTQTLTNSDFGLTANVATIANQYVDVCKYIVKAGQMLAAGANRPQGTNIFGERVYIRLDDSGGQVHGKIRILYRNPQGNRTLVVFEETTERLSASMNDVNQAVLLPEYPIRIPEDSELVIQIRANTSTTIVYNDADTKILLPVTIYQ
ncbi:MAG: hypothetical protein QW474_02250 [Candidatus Aenigmatarchaeota archaeon]